MSSILTARNAISIRLLKTVTRGGRIGSISCLPVMNSPKPPPHKFPISLCKLRTYVLADLSISALFYAGFEAEDKNFAHTPGAARMQVWSQWIPGLSLLMTGAFYIGFSLAPTIDAGLRESRIRETGQRNK